MYEVCLENLLRDTEKIATWERISGSCAELESFEYIKQKLAEVGCKTTLYSHDAYVSIPEQAELTLNGVSFECRTHSMSPSVQGLQAPLVFVGKTADMNEKVCAGRIVVIRGRAERDPVIKAAEVGAVGLVCISGEYIYEACLSPIWGSPSYKNKHLLPTVPTVSISLATWDLIQEHITKHESNLATLNCQASSKWHKQPLLVAEINAEQSTDKFVMFSAHVDSWFHGAMDNGSANAILMEVGRVAAQNRNKLKNNLRLVFFSGHSQGRYSGSCWYFEKMWEDIHYNCIISVNIDSPGAIGANDLTRSTIMPEGKPFAQKLIKELTGVDFVGRRYSRFADQSFWGTGVSCSFASFSKQILDGQTTVGKFTIPVGGSLDLGWWWHTPADTFDKIDADNLYRDAKIFVNYIMHYLNNSVIDLDFRVSIQEIIAALQDWQNKAGDRVDLQLAITRAEQVAEHLAVLYATQPTEQSSCEEIANFNQKIWRVGRLLVAMNYTQGDVYRNDPAVPQPPVPALMDINALIKADSTEEFLEIELEVKRGLNYVMHSLREVLRALGR